MFFRIACYSTFLAAIAFFAGHCQAQQIGEEAPPPPAMSHLEMREINYWKDVEQRHPSLYHRVLASNDRVRDLIAKVDGNIQPQGEAMIENPPPPAEQSAEPLVQQPDTQPMDEPGDGR
jgi:hypothetical protein